MSKHLGSVIPLKAYLVDSSGNPQTGRTVTAHVRRDTDEYYWTGSAWQVGVASVTLVEQNTGMYKYDLNTGHASFLTVASLTIYIFDSALGYLGSYSMNFTLDEDYEARDVADDILVDTGTTLPATLTTIEGKIDIIDTNVDDIETDTGTTLPATLATIDGIVDDIKQAIIVGSGTVTLLGSQTVFQTDLTDADDFWDNLQILMISGSNAGQARRISDFANANGQVTVSESFKNNVALNDTFILIGRYTGSGSALTEAGIADAVLEESVDDHKGVANSLAEHIDEIQVDTDEIQGKLPSKATLRGTADADGGMDTEDKADIEAECGDALTTYDPPTRTEATADKDAIIAEVDANETKIDTVITDIGTHDTDIKALIGTPVTDLATDIADCDAQVVTSEGVITTDIATHDTDIKNLIGTPAVDISADIAANLAAITSIQNNTRFTSALPVYMQKPDAGNRAFRWTGNLYDTVGNMEDPANNEILVRVLQADGTAITANMYKEVGLSNLLDNATDQVNFPSGSGWRAMERLGVGQYDLFYKVAHNETEEALVVEFGWDEGGSILKQTRSTEVSDVKGDIEDIQSNVQDIHDKLPDNYIMGSGVVTDKDDDIDEIHVKTDATTPSPTIPAQITTHDTDIKALPRVQACPDLMYVPSGRTQIDLEGGITAIATEIPVLLSDNLLESGIVKIESEYIIYDGITDSKLQVTSRGAYGTSGATHADDVIVSQSLLFPIRLVIRDNEGNMLAPDSIPTIEIEDWNGTQELAPTVMTLKSTGIYGYNYIIDYGEIAENKLFKFVTVIDAITAQHRHEVVIIDQPASSLELVQYLGGGTGDYILDQDGWYDVDGVKTAWTDVAVGYVRDADTGAPLDDAYVTAYPIINGETRYSGRPTGQARTRVNGTWIMALDAGTYTFVIEKDGFRIVGGGVVERTVG